MPREAQRVTVGLDELHVAPRTGLGDVHEHAAPRALRQMAIDPAKTEPMPLHLSSGKRPLARAKSLMR
jgi:hypothetical protein